MDNKYGFKFRETQKTISIEIDHRIRDNALYLYSELLELDFA